MCVTWCGVSVLCIIPAAVSTLAAARLCLRCVPAVLAASRVLLDVPLAKGVAVARAPAGAVVMVGGGQWWWHGQRFDAAVYLPQSRLFPREFGVPRKKGWWS